ncbi:MAG TPA: hypothetical protein PLZ29_11565, partial [Spirochaetota bacterium]|nr:hypothetical protein [Spirochaetota bacterium]
MVTTRNIIITINAINKHQSIKSYYHPKNYYITFILFANTMLVNQYSTVYNVAYCITINKSTNFLDI